MRELTCDPNSETLGAGVLAFYNNLRGESTRPVMRKYGLTDIQPSDWLPTQNYMSALNELSKSEDFMSSLVAIGMEIGQIIPLPPGMENATMGEVLQVWDSIYQSLHRKADVGKIAVEKIGDKHYKVTFTDLYPDDFSYGIMYGYAKRFLPAGTDFTIRYDPEVTPRDRGGEKGFSVIHATWE